MFGVGLQCCVRILRFSCRHCSSCGSRLFSWGVLKTFFSPSFHEILAGIGLAQQDAQSLETLHTFDSIAIIMIFRLVQVRLLSLFCGSWLNGFQCNWLDTSFGPNVSFQSYCGKSSAMAEFSLGLSLRASQQTLAAKMRLRNQMNRMMIFVEVASTLVMIQVGLFTHELYCIFPFLFLVVAGIFKHADFLRGRLHKSFVGRTFISIFACEESLLDAATPTMTVARLLSLLARIACSFVCYRLIAFGTCPVMMAAADYSCFSSTWRATTTVTMTRTTTTGTTTLIGGNVTKSSVGTVSSVTDHPHTAEWEGWEGRKWIGWPQSLPILDEWREVSGWAPLTGQKALEVHEKVCGPEDAWANLSRHEMEIMGFTLLILEWGVAMDLCNSDLNLVPAMFLASCEMGEVDPIQYQRCRQVTAEGGCNAAFMLCATRLRGSTTSSWFLLVFYFYFPHLAVCLLCSFWGVVVGIAIPGCARFFWYVVWLQQGAEFERVANNEAQVVRIAMEQTHADAGTEFGNSTESSPVATKIIEEHPAIEEAVAKTTVCIKEELRKEIQLKSAELKAQLDRGEFFDSLFWDRRSLELKVFFFFLDILLDLWCCLTYLLSENYGFAACQSTIIIISGIVQFWRVRGRDVRQALTRSWDVGLPTDTIFRLLIAEKAFEAPMSLCLQYFSAFHLTENLAAFISLEISMAISIVGIGEGIYSSRLLVETAGPKPSQPSKPPKRHNEETVASKLSSPPKLSVLITDAGAPGSEVPDCNEPLPPPQGLWVNQLADALPPPGLKRSALEQPANTPPGMIGKQIGGAPAQPSATNGGSPAMPPGQAANGPPGMIGKQIGGAPAQPSATNGGSPAMPPGQAANGPPGMIGKQIGGAPAQPSATNGSPAMPPGQAANTPPGMIGKQIGGAPAQPSATNGGSPAMPPGQAANTPPGMIGKQIGGAPAQPSATNGGSPAMPPGQAANGPPGMIGKQIGGAPAQPSATNGGSTNGSSPAMPPGQAANRPPSMIGKQYGGYPAMPPGQQANRPPGMIGKQHGGYPAMPPGQPANRPPGMIGKQYGGYPAMPAGQPANRPPGMIGKQHGGYPAMPPEQPANRPPGMIGKQIGGAPAGPSATNGGYPAMPPPGLAAKRPRFPAIQLEGDRIAETE